MSFTQLIQIDDADHQELAEHVAGWHRDQAGAAPGYLNARVLADVDRPGRHVIAVEFASADQARQNNERPETARWAETLRSLGTLGDDAYRNLRQVITTHELT